MSNKQQTTKGDLKKVSGGAGSLNIGGTGSKPSDTKPSAKPGTGVSISPAPGAKPSPKNSPSSL